MSKLNCKPGDLAVFVRSKHGNLGRVVRCLRLVKRSDYVLGDVWETDTPCFNSWGYWECFAMDAYLRPLRDPGEDARDETLTWLPVPSTTKESA